MTLLVGGADRRLSSCDIQAFIYSETIFIFILYTKGRFVFPSSMNSISSDQIDSFSQLVHVVMRYARMQKIVFMIGLIRRLCGIR